MDFLQSSFRRLAMNIQLALFIALALAVTSVGAVEAETTTVYIVRHAEKDTSKINGKVNPDPGLTAAGKERAQTLAAMLKESGIKAIYASSYRRTQETAAPLAALLQITVEKPGSPEAIVDAIIRNHAGDAVLVVGHTNTIPDIAARLGAAKVPSPMESEYDLLLTVRRNGDKVDLKVERYGKPTPH